MLGYSLLRGLVEVASFPRSTHTPSKEERLQQGLLWALGRFIPNADCGRKKKGSYRSSYTREADISPPLVLLWQPSCGDLPYTLLEKQAAPQAGRRASGMPLPGRLDPTRDARGPAKQKPHL